MIGQIELIDCSSFVICIEGSKTKGGQYLCWILL